MSRSWRLLLTVFLLQWYTPGVKSEPHSRCGDLGQYRLDDFMVHTSLRDLAISSDGRHVLLSANDSGSYGVYSIDIADGRRTLQERLRATSPGSLLPAEILFAEAGNLPRQIAIFLALLSLAQQQRVHLIHSEDGNLLSLQAAQI